jgi:hypothetical protein
MFPSTKGSISLAILRVKFRRRLIFAATAAKSVPSNALDGNLTSTYQEGDELRAANEHKKEKF